MSPITIRAAPLDADAVQRRNFINVQIDAIGVGFASAATPFLPVFLTRLGASNIQIGLLTSMPALTGLVFSIIVGRFLQNQPRIVPWFSLARLLVISSYAVTGLVTFFIPESNLVNAILVVWAVATIPQTILAVSFSLVMNEVAGPKHRFELMSRRWSILGFTTAVTVALVGQVLERVQPPLNYQVVFIGLSIGGFVSYYFSSQINLPQHQIILPNIRKTWVERLQDYRAQILKERDFLRFILKRFVFYSGTMLSIPLFPLYYVRQVHANDAWIGAINTIQASVLLVGYFMWTRESRLRGSRFVLVWTTFALSFYPALVAATQKVEFMALFAGIAAIFQAGLDLVFFDELMKTVPEMYSAVFISFAQSMQYLSAILAPLLGTWLSIHIGLVGAMLVSTGLRFAGYILFAVRTR